MYILDIVFISSLESKKEVSLLTSILLPCAHSKILIHMHKFRKFEKKLSITKKVTEQGKST